MTALWRRLKARVSAFSEACFYMTPAGQLHLLMNLQMETHRLYIQALLGSRRNRRVVAGDDLLLRPLDAQELEQWFELEGKR